MIWVLAVVQASNCIQSGGAPNGIEKGFELPVPIPLNVNFTGYAACLDELAGLMFADGAACMKTQAAGTLLEVGAEIPPNEKFAGAGTWTKQGEESLAVVGWASAFEAAGGGGAVKLKLRDLLAGTDGCQKLGAHDSRTYTTRANRGLTEGAVEDGTVGTDGCALMSSAGVANENYRKGEVLIVLRSAILRWTICTAEGFGRSGALAGVVGIVKGGKSDVNDLAIATAEVRLAAGLAKRTGHNVAAVSKIIVGAADYGANYRDYRDTPNYRPMKRVYAHGAAMSEDIIPFPLDGEPDADEDKCFQSSRRTVAAVRAMPRTPPCPSPNCARDTAPQLVLIIFQKVVRPADTFSVAVNTQQAIGNCFLLFRNLLICHLEFPEFSRQLGDASGTYSS
ncbi:hypothetical protein BC835DRAFT_1303338 [Cytidiella melzeri]|nr:hypothetical protein BC835DRAFT_1303338 [Cytidiella melzeri]